MKRIPAVLPSLIATALAGPALAPPARAAAPNACQVCRSEAGSTGARQLLRDGRLVARTRNRLQQLLDIRPEDAEEAAQEAALRALDRGVTACCSEGMQRWLFRTGKNYMVDTLRRKQVLPLSQGQDDDRDPMSVVPSTATAPGAALELREHLEATLTHHDVRRMKPEKLVQLGRAVGERLGEGTARRPIPQVTELVDRLPEAIAEL
ncbi:MAG: hypothetical protein KDC87_01565 [Planctomycetes bacterium]|nr:hypothetical protein [Planctomycetota bacterium]MCB9869056.1 hypothetical protein [Planctomycetota bacterium]MCB9888015.1 hypothetical protein [Planctomycetota bacterium]